jgi:hypothetical protein
MDGMFTGSECEWALNLFFWQNLVTCQSIFVQKKKKKSAKVARSRNFVLP